jgi:hypothetical protein
MRAAYERAAPIDASGSDDPATAGAEVSPNPATPDPADEPNPAEDPDAADDDLSATDLVARELGATVVEQVRDG